MLWGVRLHSLATSATLEAPNPGYSTEMQKETDESSLIASKPPKAHNPKPEHWARNSKPPEACVNHQVRTWSEGDRKVVPVNIREIWRCRKHLVGQVPKLRVSAFCCKGLGLRVLGLGMFRV